MAISLRADDDWAALRPVLAAAGVDLAGAPDGADEARHDEIDELLRSWTSTRPADDVVAELRALGVPAARAIVSSEMYDQPQLEARGFYSRVDHPVSGPRRYPGWPMRFDPGPGDHHRLPCPTLGQHNDEVLGGELDLTGPELDDLRARQVIGHEPLGL